MKKKRKGCLVTLAVLVGAVVALFGAAQLSVHFAIREYDQLDHPAVLAACRLMLTQRDDLTNSPSCREPHSWTHGSVCLDRNLAAYGPEIPLVIRDLNPRYIVIHDDNLIISDPIPFPPMRRGAIAFAEDVGFQYGTRQYLDGLWYWNGNMHPSVRPEWDRRMDEKIKRIKGQQTDGAVTQESARSAAP